MDFGSAFVLSRTVTNNDYEEVENVNYNAALEQNMEQNVKSRGDDVCMISILDTAGQEEYSSLRDQFTRGSDGFLIVYAINDRNSFQEAKMIYEYQCRLLQKSSVPAVLCANKSDLVYKRTVTHAEAVTWASSHKIPVFETSAKTALNIHEAFVALVRIVGRPRNATKYGFLEYMFALVGSGGVGKTSICCQFSYGSFVENYDPTIEDTYRKQLVVSGISQFKPPPKPRPFSLKRPNTFSASASSSDVTPSSSTTKPERRRSLISRVFRAFSFSPASSSTSPPKSPPSYEQATMKSADIGASIPLDPNRRRIPKCDTNILYLSLGSLAPENFETLEIHTLTHPPPLCSSCAAVRTDDTCPFCGTKAPDTINMLEQRPIEEYTLVKSIQAAIALSPVAASAPRQTSTDQSLVVFCIDVSGSMSTSQRRQQTQAIWNQIKYNASSIDQQYISRLQCMQDAVATHIDRLIQHYPSRKVAILSFSDSVSPYIGNDDMSGHQTTQQHQITNLESGMSFSSQLVSEEWSRKWPNVSQCADRLHKHVESLYTQGGTAAGCALALALGLAKSHKERFHAETEIFLCTDGASNVGIGKVSQTGDHHGRSFYMQAGKVATMHGATINVIGIEGEGVALDVIATAAQASGGMVNNVTPDGIRREIRTASQRRTIAKDVSVEVYVPRGWKFHSNQRKGVQVRDKRLTYKIAQVHDDTEIGFAFNFDGWGDIKTRETATFQAHIKYICAKTGDTKMRVMTRTIPVADDRDQVEAACDVGIAGTYIIQSVAARAYQILIENTSMSATAKMQVSALRDGLYAAHQMLIRAAQTTAQQEELANFAHESSKLDQALEILFRSGVYGPTRDSLTTALMRGMSLTRYEVVTTARRTGKQKMRTQLI